MPKGQLCPTASDDVGAAAAGQYWKTHHNPLWLFPAPGRGMHQARTATEPMNLNGVQAAFRAALKETGLNKTAAVHTRQGVG